MLTRSGHSDLFVRIYVTCARIVLRWLVLRMEHHVTVTDRRRGVTRSGACGGRPLCFHDSAVFPSGFVGVEVLLLLLFSFLSTLLSLFDVTEVGVGVSFVGQGGFP